MRRITLLRARRSAFLAGSAIAGLTVVSACDRTLSPTLAPEIEPSLSVVGAPAVRLTYMCGNRFRVRNEGLREVRLRYDVYRTSEQSPMTVIGRDSAALFEEVFFETTNRGTVRLFDASTGRLLSTRANGGTTCSVSLPYTITVRVHDGVEGSPASGTYAVPAGSQFTWAYASRAGFDSIAVEADYAELGATGAFVVNRSRTVDVYARPVPPALRQEAAAAFQAFRTLHTPGAPVQASWDRFVAEYARLADRIGAEAASEQAELMSREVGRSAEMIRRKIELEDSIRVLASSGSGAPAGFRSVEAGRPREPVRVAYVNGIWSDHATWLATTLNLKLALQSTLGRPLRDDAVDGYYSRWQPVISAPVFLLDCFLYVVRDEWSANRVAAALENRCGATGQLPDLLEAGLQKLSTRVPIYRPDDARGLQNYLRGRLVHGDQVVVVAHSQGALMARDAFAGLDADSLLNLRRDSTDAALLTIGAPQRSQFPPHLATGRLRHVITRCDGVADLQGAPSEGELTVVESVPACPAVVQPRSPLDLLRSTASVINYIKFSLFVAHGINDQYLRFSASRSAIQGDVRVLADELVAGSLEIGEFEVGVGDTARIASRVRVLNAAGTRFLERRRPAVDVSPEVVAEGIGDSLIVARSLGRAIVLAELWDLLGAGAVVVTPPPPPAAVFWGNFPSPSLATVVINSARPIASVAGTIGGATASVVQASSTQWLVRVPLATRVPTGTSCAAGSFGFPEFGMQVPPADVAVAFTDGTTYSVTAASPGFAVFACGFFFESFRGYRGEFP